MGQNQKAGDHPQFNSGSGPARILSGSSGGALSPASIDTLPKTKINGSNAIAMPMPISPMPQGSLAN